MKKLFLSIGLSIILLNSCTTRVVSSEKPYSDDKISNGKTYSFFSNDGSKKVFTVEKIDANTITGKNAEGKVMSIEKSEISKINKSNTLATVGLVALVLGLALFTPTYINNGSK